MSVELIEKWLETNPRARDEIGDLPKILGREIQRLISLLKQFRLCEMPKDENLQPTSLAAEVRDILALQSAYYERRRIRIEPKIALDLPCIIADPDKLRQVILNLCNNAVEAMPDGGTLTLRTYADDGWLCLDVTDTGNGIPAGMKIFQPGVTSKPNGSGLGLPIARDLIEERHGTVSYTTKPGHGTTFHVKFPLGERDPSTASPELPRQMRKMPTSESQEVVAR